MDVRFLDADGQTSLYKKHMCCEALINYPVINE